MCIPTNARRPRTQPDFVTRPPCGPGLAVVWAVLRPALAPPITAINWIHRCDNAATRSSKTTTSQPYVTGVATETRSPAAPNPRK